MKSDFSDYSFYEKHWWNVYFKKNYEGVTFLYLEFVPIGVQIRVCVNSSEMHTHQWIDSSLQHIYNSKSINSFNAFVNNIFRIANNFWKWMKHMNIFTAT